MAKREIKAVSYINVDNIPVLWEKAKPELREKCIQKTMESLGETLSEYFSANINEAKCLTDLH